MPSDEKKIKKSRQGKHKRHDFFSLLLLTDLKDVRIHKKIKKLYYGACITYKTM